MSVDFRAPILVGSRLGHFVIRGMLGTGGMGQVYDAEDTRLHRPVALKVVRFDVASDPVRRARLEREAGALAVLQPPNILTRQPPGKTDWILFLSMERIDGAPLSAA